MKKKELNRLILHQMREIYYPEGAKYIDWMGYQITEKNHPSYHHIEKKETLKQQGKSTDSTLENGAYLGQTSHEMLHRIELIDTDLYIAWNQLFFLINRKKTYPTEEIWEIIKILQEQSEELLKQDEKTLRKRKKEVARKKV